MGSIFATLAFKTFETLWTVYEKKHGQGRKTQREVDLENLLKKQNALLAKAKAYSKQCSEQVSEAEASMEVYKDRALVAERQVRHLQAMIAEFVRKSVPENPY
jgi:RNA-splicing ligase RtcB